MADAEMRRGRSLGLRLRAGPQRRVCPEATGDQVWGRMSSPKESPQPSTEEARQPWACLPWYWALKPRCRWLPSEVKCSRSQFLLLMTGAGRLAPVNLWGQEGGRVRNHRWLGQETPHFPCKPGPLPDGLSSWNPPAAGGLSGLGCSSRDPSHHWVSLRCFGGGAGPSGLEQRSSPPRREV